MPDKHTDNTALSAALEAGWLILTPNHRISVQLHESYGALRKARSQTVVLTSPAITPIDIWIKRFYQELLHVEDSVPIATILESSQELALWQRIIRESSLSSPLLSLENAAANVLEAHRLMTQWQIDFSSLHAFQYGAPESAYVDDCSAFIHWERQYQHTCKQKNLISFSELLQKILPLLGKHPSVLPEKIILLEFDDPPPLYQELFAILQKHCELQFLQWQPCQAEIVKQSYPDSTAEIQAVADWSKAILADNPSAKIGVISTELQTQRSLYRRIFSAVFSEHRANASTFFIASASDISVELPMLFEIPALFNLNQEEIPTLEFCQLLRSPLLVASTEEENARAACEFHLRNLGQAKLRNADVRSLLNQSKRIWYCPLLCRSLQQAETLRRQQKYRQSIFAWADFFAEQLMLLAWPNAEDRDAHGFLVNCWQQVLTDYKKLAFLYPELSLAEAHELLKQVVNKFQSPVYRQEAPIQILSPRDANGLQFTNLWFTGLTDLQWPEKHYTNPFIPLPLQRKLRLPDSSPELVYDAARKTLTGLIENTSAQAMLTYPRANENSDLNPSPLLAAIAPATVISHIPSQSIPRQLHPACLQSYFASDRMQATETLDENLYLKVADNETIKGGINLITNQAECPFRAFAVHRLQAQELPELRYGIPARDLGNMLHKILEHLWSILKNQQELASLPVKTLEQIVTTASESGLQYLQQKHGHFMKPVYLALEKQRLFTLLMKWLDQEKLRSPFEVLAMEQPIEWQYAGLKLSFKIDRIDKLRQGLAVVDYKSGIAPKPVWDDERPSHPQLLLYADALTQDNKHQTVEALLYAQINIEELTYRGLSAADSVYPKTALSEQKQLAEQFDWDSLMQHWQNALHKLAQEFMDGYLAVAPKSPTSCQYCHLSAFCRIKEADRVSHD